MRRLDDRFFQDLKDGILAPLTNAVKSDTSLCLELRGDSINVYYRGGNLMKVTQTDKGYSAFFDENYFKCGKKAGLPANIRSKEDVDKWLGASSDLKQAIDLYLGRKPNYEREIQQTILRDNNFGSIAKSTDYYICDIEYQSEHGRFDMIATHWPSTPSERKNPRKRRLVFIEIKHGDGALKYDAGLHGHIKDVNNYLDDPDKLSSIKEEMIDVFNQKRGLGLICCRNDLASFSNEKPLLLLALVNHDPESSILHGLLDGLPKSPGADLAIATASFLGYGLYDQGIHTIEEAKKRFGDYIYSSS